MAQKLLLAFILSLLVGPVFAQQSPLVVEDSETFTLRGPNADHQIQVILPPGYDSGRPELYPVLYYVDAWWLTELVSGTARIAKLSRGNGYDAPILVGIGVEGDADAWNAHRNLDLTPSPLRLPPGLILCAGDLKIDSSNTGGAEKFLAFLRNVVVPKIEADYPVDPDRRGWLGHSFGGLFGVWSLTSPPNLFSDLILISPSVWWNNQEVTQAIKSATGIEAFVAYGKLEDNPILKTVPPFADSLDAAGALVQLSAYEGRDHISVLMPALWDGLLYLYER